MVSDGMAAGQLKGFLERIEMLEDEKRTTAEDIQGVYAEAKAEGFDVKILRVIVRLRRLKPHDRQEQEELTKLYKQAVGMD